MASKLGVDLSINNLVPFFFHPVMNNKIFVMFDVVHDLKLIRNTFASKGFILDETGKYKSIRENSIQAMACILRTSYATNMLTFIGKK